MSFYFKLGCDALFYSGVETDGSYLLEEKLPVIIGVLD